VTKIKNTNNTTNSTKRNIKAAQEFLDRKCSSCVHMRLKLKHKEGGDHAVAYLFILASAGRLKDVFFSRPDMFAQIALVSRLLLSQCVLLLSTFSNEA
jgi:hypothetical protein